MQGLEGKSHVLILRASYSSEYNRKIMVWCCWFRLRMGWEGGVWFLSNLRKLVFLFILIFPRKLRELNVIQEIHRLRNRGRWIVFRSFGRVLWKRRKTRDWMKIWILSFEISSLERHMPLTIAIRISIIKQSRIKSKHLLNSTATFPKNQITNIHPLKTHQQTKINNN